MMDFNSIDKPFVNKLGFGKLFKKLDIIVTDDNNLEKERAEILLSQINNRDILTNGLNTDKEFSTYSDEIKILISSLFPFSLTDNEIKAAFVPLSSHILYSSNRYKKIFRSDKELLEKEFGEQDPDTIYIMMCTYILESHYNFRFNFKAPPIYPIQNEIGVTKYYKSTYNADFIDLRPIGEAPTITEEKLKELKENIENIDLWKKVFPPFSWEVNGFGIKYFVDVSRDEAISRIKNKLLAYATDQATRTQIYKEEMDRDISTLLNIPNVSSSFTRYDSKNKKFNRISDSDLSFSLGNHAEQDKDSLMCSSCQNQIFFNKQAFITSDVNSSTESGALFSMYQSLKDQNIQSYMCIPLYDNNTLLGILEFGHKDIDIFNKTHAIILKAIEDECSNLIKQYNSEWESNISSIIQHEFTSIHPSVEWKFEEEAERKAQAILNDEEYNFNKIVFDGLTALYGQMDISGSSNARNEAIAADLINQLISIKEICSKLMSELKMPIIGNFIFEIDRYYDMLTYDIDAGIEQEIVAFIKDNIHPFFEELNLRDDNNDPLIDAYFNRIHKMRSIFYEKRKDYDDSVSLINSYLSAGLDADQKTAQQIYPHYFERYKTDGVEHNIFVGQSISPNIHFNKLYIENLRLWQLEIMCKLEIEHNKRLNQLPVPLKIASLIMVYSNTIAIRYRMDEKQFDIDGAYNARYEIIKKRIDKAHIKGTQERITQPGKIVIIYTQNSDLREQQRYIKYLIAKGYLTDNIELFDIEDLQGVSGLKGIRVELNFNNESKLTNQTNIKIDDILSEN